MYQQPDDNSQWLEQIKWNEAGLVAVIAQQVETGKVLMVAWMSRESLQLTIERGEAVYWSRSRNKLWHKGEVSGNTQRVCEIRLDCDADVLLLQVRQRGGIACHTGSQHCFFRRYKKGQWVVSDPVLHNPDTMYARKNTLKN